MLSEYPLPVTSTRKYMPTDPAGGITGTCSSPGFVCVL